MIYHGGIGDNEPSRLDCVSFWSFPFCRGSRGTIERSNDDRGNDFYDKTESKSRRGSDTDLAQLGQGRRPLELAGHTSYTRCKRDGDRDRESASIGL